MTLTQSQLMHLKKLSKGLLKMDFYETQIKAMLIILKGDDTPTIEKLSYLYKNGFINDSCLCYYFISELYPNTSQEEFEVVLQNSIRNLGLKDFSAQALACTRALGLADNDPRINPNGGAIAIGHPLGMSGTRILQAATNQLIRTGGKYALATMCVGVGMGYAMIIERA